MGHSFLKSFRKFIEIYFLPDSIDKDAAKGKTSWSYPIGDADGKGQTTVTFKNGKVVSIGS